MARKTLLHYLFSKDGKPLYRSGNATLEGDPITYATQDGLPAHLQVDPEGWRDVLVKFARNIKWWGMFRDFTVPMTFKKDGAKILSDKMWTFGVEAVVNYGILKLDRTTLPYEYKAWYVSEINFVKYAQDKSGVVVECLQGGISKYLKAYETTTYEIDIESDPLHKTVLMDGMELENSAQFAITSGASIDPTANYGNHLVDMTIVTKEIEDIGGVAPVTRTKVTNLNPTIKATGKWFFIATAAGTVKVEYDYTLKVDFFAPPAINPAANLAHVVRKIDKTGFGLSTNLLTPLPTGAGIPGTYHIQGTKDIDVLPGDELYLYTFLNVEGSTGDAQATFEYGGDEPFFKISYTFKEEPTIAKGLSPKRLLEKLIEQATDAEPGVYGVVSSFLDSLEESILMVSGDSMRRVPGAKIKTSIADYFKSFNRWGISMGAEEKNVRLERFAYVFQDDVVFDVGEVTGAKIVNAEDIMFNTIKNGYKAQDYKEINGRLEFNQGQQWTTPGTKIIKELDLVSVYRADPFGAELMRINFGQKKTTDSDSDNDTWFLNIRKNFTTIQGQLNFVTLFPPLDLPFIIVSGVTAEQMAVVKKGVKFRILGTAFNNAIYTAASDALPTADPGVYSIPLDSTLFTLTNENVFGTIQVQEYILNRPPYTLVEGLLHPATAFNIELSPKRSLLENGAYLRSVLDLMDGQEIKFRSSDKNADLVTTLGGVTIRENENIKIGSLPARLFRPYYITFRTKVPLSAYDLLNLKPYSKIRFWHEGEPFTGYLFDGGVKPDVFESQDWKLLSSPENDLRKFKTY